MTWELPKTLNLLSSMYLFKPTKEVLENWKGLLTQDTPDFMLNLKEALDKIDLHAKQQLEDLLWEYTRLFIGPYKLPCPPWESVYTSGKKLMMQEAYDQVQEFYLEAGLVVGDPNIMSDHIGAELNFLAVLYEKMNSEAEKCPFYEGIVKRFLDEHARKWIPQFTADLENAADSQFYKALARVTHDAIMKDL